MPLTIPKTRAGKIRKAVKMRKMKNPHSPEEIQRIVNETGLSKAEVEEIIRRRNTAFVEHGTGPEPAVSIGRDGFKLEPRWAKFRMRRKADREHIEEVDRAFDMLRPEHLKHLSRVNSHYFFPSIQGLKIGHGYWGRVLGQKLPYQKGGAKVRARVNSAEAYVFEQSIPLCEYLLPSIDAKGDSLSHEKMAKLPGFISKAKKYWQRGIPLNLFKRRYKYDRRERGWVLQRERGWVLQPGPKSAELWPGEPRRHLPEFYLSPEVLVGGEIPTKDIRIWKGKKANKKG